MSSCKEGFQKRYKRAIKKYKKLSKFSKNQKTQCGHLLIMEDQGGLGCSQKQVKVMDWDRSGPRKQP